MTSVLALAAPRRSAARALPLLRLLADGVDVVSYRSIEGAGGPTPDAIVATSVLALPVLPAVPTVVWVDDDDELAAASANPSVVACLSSDPALVAQGAIAVPRSGIEVDRWPPISPLVRSRWRERFALPAHLVVGIDPPLDPARPSSALALASAAVVVGDATPLALALGTPLVTSAANAKRFGLRPGVDAEVAAGPQAATALAAQIAADDGRAAVLSRRGRRVAERHLDLGEPARTVRRLLELGPAVADAWAESPPLPERLAERLAELGTSPGSLLRARAAVAVSPLLATSTTGGPR